MVLQVLKMIHHLSIHWSYRQCLLLKSPLSLQSTHQIDRQ
jgi:hypothetical protein